jgi:hypothetical protein
MCICVCVCVRLKLKYHLCIAQHEACKDMFKYLIFYGKMCNILHFIKGRFQ